MRKPLVLANFLPQFHECEFNNKWWGKGFTEWNNVRSSRALKSGHKQPKKYLLGEYDLLEPDQLNKQFSDAKLSGIDGFNIYHYWYEGERPLGKVLDLILSDTSIKVNFSLCWANHSWTRSWRNRAGTLDVLINQTYETDLSKEAEHFEFLNKVFLDPRYIKVDGRPVFQIYIPEDVPELDKYLLRLSKYCRDNGGVEPIFVGTIRRPTKVDEYHKLFDYMVLAQPVVGLNFDLESFFNEKRQLSKAKIRSEILRLPTKFKKYIYRVQDMVPSKPKFVDYTNVQENCLLIAEGFLSRYENTLLMSFVDFDNTPRYKKRATVMDSYSNAVFSRTIESSYNLAKQNRHPLFYINAWNEWGEGMYLQECNDYGESRLEIVKKVIADSK